MRNYWSDYIQRKIEISQARWAMEHPKGVTTVIQTSPTQDILNQFDELVVQLKTLKGDMRSEEARYIAIVITETEKALAMFNTYVHESYNYKQRNGE